MDWAFVGHGFLHAKPPFDAIVETALAEGADEIAIYPFSMSEDRFVTTALGLELRVVEEQGWAATPSGHTLRFYDPATAEFLRSHEEERDDRLAERAARQDAEAARQQAEARAAAAEAALRAAEERLKAAGASQAGLDAGAEDKQA